MVAPGQRGKGEVIVETRPASVEIYSIGHSSVPVGEIVKLLQGHGVAVLVDVRSVPYSQYAPQFNREAFEQVLDKAGINYAFAGEYLGGRPKDLTCYKADDVVDYEEVARRPWFQKGIVRLLDIASTRRTAFMCSEEDPNDCHRHKLIAKTLREMGVAVWHIRGNGRLEPAEFQLSLF